MTYLQFVQQVAHSLGVTDVEARRVVGGVFGVVRANVLVFDERVAIPQFGTFHRAETKGGVRSFGKAGSREVPSSRHIRFRSAKAAKTRAP